MGRLRLSRTTTSSSTSLVVARIAGTLASCGNIGLANGISRDETTEAAFRLNRVVLLTNSLHPVPFDTALEIPADFLKSVEWA